MFAVAHALTRTHDTTPPHLMRLNDTHPAVIDVFDPVGGFLRSQLERNVRLAHGKPNGCPICQQRRIDGTWRALRAWERLAIRGGERALDFEGWYRQLPKPDGRCQHQAADYAVMPTKDSELEPSPEGKPRHIAHGDRHRYGTVAGRKELSLLIQRRTLAAAQERYDEAMRREANRRALRETTPKRIPRALPSVDPTAVQVLRRNRPEGGFTLYPVKPHRPFLGELPVETGVQDLCDLAYLRKVAAPDSRARRWAAGHEDARKRAAAKQLVAHAEERLAAIKAEPPLLATVWSSTDTDWLREIRAAVVEEMLYLEDEQRETHDGYSLVGLPYNPQADDPRPAPKGERKQVFRSAFGDGSPAAFLEEGELEQLVDDRIDEIREFTSDSDRDVEDYVYMAIGAGSVLHDAEAGLAFGAFDISLKPFFEAVEDRYEAGSIQSTYDDLDGDRGAPGLYEQREADVWTSGLRAARRSKHSGWGPLTKAEHDALEARAAFERRRDAQRRAAAVTNPSQLELLRIAHRRLDHWIGVIEEWKGAGQYDWHGRIHDSPVTWLHQMEPTSPLLRLPAWADVREPEYNDEATAGEIVDGEEAVEVYG